MKTKMDAKRSDSLQIPNGKKMMEPIIKRNSVPNTQTYNVRKPNNFGHSASVGNRRQLHTTLPYQNGFSNSLAFNTVLLQSIVAYLGTVQLYAKPKEIPSKSVSAMKSCIERLRREQHIHQRVVLKVM